MGRLLFGTDIRACGSGNAGGTNALRVLGWRAGLFVIVVDVGKGALAALLPALLAIPSPAWLPLACAALAVAGHCFPVLARFHGGKGIATGAGALVVLAPGAVAVCAVVWAVLVATTRLVSLASLLAAAVLPGAVAVLGGSVPGLLPVSFALAAFVAWAHRDNLRRLLHGEERRLVVARRPPTPA